MLLYSSTAQWHCPKVLLEAIKEQWSPEVDTAQQCFATRNTGLNLYSSL
jgi:hypothetical protein